MLTLSFVVVPAVLVEGLGRRNCAGDAQMDDFTGSLTYAPNPLELPPVHLPN